MRRSFCVLLVLLTPATARADWSPPERIADGEVRRLEALTTLDGGRVRAALSDPSQDMGLALADATAGGPFGPLRRVMPEDRAATSTELAADGSGVVVTSRRGAPLRVVAFDAEGRAAEPLVLAPDLTPSALAVSPAGAAAVAWLRPAGDRSEVVVAVREAGSSSFGSPMRAGINRSARAELQVGVSDRGEVVVAWQEEAYPSALHAAVRLPGQSFAAPTRVERSASITDLAVGADGDAVITAPQDQELRVAVKRAGAPAMPAARPIDHAPQSYEDAPAAAAAGGWVGVVWNVDERGRDRRTSARVYLARAGEPLRRVGRLGQSASQPELAVDARGRAVVGWTEDVPGPQGTVASRSRVALAYKGVGRGFGRVRLVGPTVLSSTPLALRLDGPSGRALAAFESLQDSAAESFRRVYVTRSLPR